jgi:hypothetical protein
LSLFDPSFAGEAGKMLISTPVCCKPVKGALFLFTFCQVYTKDFMVRQHCQLCSLGHCFHRFEKHFLGIKACLVTGQSISSSTVQDPWACL